MRSGPVNLITTGAASELLVVNFSERFEPLNYFGFGNLSQGRIAAKASCKWGDGTEKIKAPDYFDRLFFCVL
jgi:hypothetical protein